MLTSSNNILVPLGFSEQSKIALTQAIHFAKVTKAELTLLSVIEDNTSFKNALDLNESDKNIKNKVQEKLDDLAKNISSKNKLDVNTLISKGSVYEEIIKASEIIGASMIIMGTDGKPKGFTKKVIGTNAYRVVTMASCPTITISGSNHRKGCKNIVLPLDLRKETKQKVNNAIQLAQIYNSNIHIVSILTSTDDFITNHLKRNLLQVEEFITEEKVKCTATLIEPAKGQKFVEAVLEFSEKKKADLITIMTQQETNISEYFLGSTAQAIIYNSNIPVLSVQPKVTTKTIYDLPV